MNMNESSPSPAPSEKRGRFQARSLGRRVALQMLFSEDTNPGTSEKFSDDFILKELSPLAVSNKLEPAVCPEAEEGELNAECSPVNDDLALPAPLSLAGLNELTQFVRQLVHGTLEHRDEIDQILARISLNWSVSRMAPTDRNILRLAIFEMIYMKTPRAVAIHEALELGNLFGSANSCAFLNGLLDRVENNIF